MSASSIDNRVVRAYDAKMQRRFRQEIAFSQSLVSGFFRFGDLFQIKPMHEGALSLESVIGHHPLLIEFAYDVPELEETNYNPKLPEPELWSLLDRGPAETTKKTIFLLLAVFARTRLFQYPGGPLQQQWFISLPRSLNDSDCSRQPHWGHAGYHFNGLNAWVLDGFSKSEMPQIPRVNANEYYQAETPQKYVLGKTRDQFELPDRIDEFITGFLGLTDQGKASFLASCFLFEKSIDLFWQAPSLAFAASVSSLETLIAFDHQGERQERCSCCGQIKFNVRQKFLQFIETYGSDSPAIKKYADWIYNRRSKLLHEGQLSAGEVLPRTIDGAIEWLADDDSRRNVIIFFRSCVINWLILHSNQKKAL